MRSKNLGGGAKHRVVSLVKIKPNNIDFKDLEMVSKKGDLKSPPYGVRGATVSLLTALKIFDFQRTKILKKFLLGGDKRLAHI